uniref:Golgi membrane protein 1 n=1 Tax=Latimeria chalumnae TaxID=7897 RepID=H2ZUM0_LATCH
MVGLVNGRRSGRAPPLLVVALIICLVVLGFNYWTSATHNAALQKQILALERKTRMAEAELNSFERKRKEYQERQRDEIEKLQTLQKQELDSTSKVCNEQKENLLINITMSTRIIRTLQKQFKDLQGDYEMMQKKHQNCEATQSILQKKINYDLTQCNSQIKELKEQYEEKIVGLLQKINNADQLQPVKNEQKSGQEEQQVKEGNKPADNAQEENVDKQNEIQKQQEEKKEDVEKGEPKKKQLENNNLDQVAENKPEEAQDEAAEEKKGNQEELPKANGDEGQPSDQQLDKQAPDAAEKEQLDLNPDQAVDQKPPIDEDDVEREEFMQGDVNDEDAAQDPNEENEAAKIEEEEEDYNGDEGNVAEPEADKQAELADDTNGLKGSCFFFQLPLRKKIYSMESSR